LGVYMTMDELSELVKAVKENSKTSNNNNNNENHEPLAPPPPPPPAPAQHEQRTYGTNNGPPPPPPPHVPRLDLQSTNSSLPVPKTSSGQISPREQTLSIMAEKKRQKWQRERAEVERLQMEIEYDQLKHQLSPRHKPNSVSPERSTFQYDFPANGKPPVPSTSKMNDNQVFDQQARLVEEVPSGVAKTRLMEKKLQQWQQENSEKMATWDPFGRPGGGAPNPNENTARPSVNPSQAPPVQATPVPPTISNNPYRPPLPPTRLEQNTQIQPPTTLQSDQARLPAAMRTNLRFGDVRFDEDVKTAKEMDRRQWLDDLQKQVEENKRKKFPTYELPTERRPDFLHENVQPLVQEAANRHHNITKQTPMPPIPESNPTNTGEKLFGPTYDNTSKQMTNQRTDNLHLPVGYENQRHYRPVDARRDETVNTVGTTFRSEHTQSEQRMSPYKQTVYDDNDLPPYGSKGKRNSRMKSVDDKTNIRRTPTSFYPETSSNPRELNQRPLWNYRNAKQREYVPNSKKDPHYETRQRMKHFQQGDFDRIDDVQKKTCYNRWNSDSELQQHQKKPMPNNRIRSTASKPTGFGHQKDESILNLLKRQNQQQDHHGQRKASSVPIRHDDDRHSDRTSSLDKYENHPSNDEHPQSYSPVSRSRDSSPQKQITDTTNHYEESQARTAWENNYRPESIAQPMSRQDHILQQLSTIRQNLVRRQQELAT